MGKRKRKEKKTASGGKQSIFSKAFLLARKKLKSLYRTQKVPFYDHRNDTSSLIEEIAEKFAEDIERTIDEVSHIPQE